MKAIKTLARLAAFVAAFAAVFALAWAGRTGAWPDPARLFAAMVDVQRAPFFAVFAAVWVACLGMAWAGRRSDRHSGDAA